MSLSAFGARIRSSHCATDSRASESGHAAIPSLLADAERAHFGLQPLREIVPAPLACRYGAGRGRPAGPK